MLIDSGSSLNIVLAGAKTTLDAIWNVSFEDIPNGGMQQGIAIAGLPGRASGVTNGATPVAMVAAPATGYTRRVLAIQLNNADTGAITVSFSLTDNGTARVLFKGTRATLEQLTYTNVLGFQAFSVALARQ